MRSSIGATTEIRAGSSAPSCPACHSPDHRRYADARGAKLLECLACGVIYLDPLPTQDELAPFYEDSYAGATTSYFAKVGSKIRRSRRRMRALRRHVAGGRFIDIGCNGGFMVEAARERGFEAYGLDIDSVSIAYAREHYPRNRYVLGTVEAFEPTAPRFDLAYCSEVIEHVPGVDRFVATLAKLLSPGGVLFITTPDIGHWRRPKDLAAWDGFAPPAHCLYFRPASLRRLLERHGLGVFRAKLAWKPGIKMLCRREG